MNRTSKYLSGLGNSPRLGRWFLSGAVLLAAVLPALTIADRWLHIEGMGDLFRETWCRVEALCETALPPYVGIGILCTAAAILLVLVPWTRLEFPGLLVQAGNQEDPSSAPDAKSRAAGRLLRLAAVLGFLATLVAGLRAAHQPGWAYLLVVLAYAAGSALEHADLNEVLSKMRSRLPSLASGASALLGILFVIGGDYAYRPLFWLVGLALLVPLALQVRRGNLPGVRFWIAAGVIVVCAQGINSWRYAIVGDEYIFHEFARSISHPNGWATMGERLFDGRGVYGTHPYFSTVIHAASMWLFGADNYGWRINNVVIVALAAVVFLDFLRGFLRGPVATLGAILMASSHYLINFSKIGYNNLQALLATVLVLAAGSWAARSRRPMAFTLLGLAMGLCLYVYPAALYMLPLGILFPWIVAPPGQKPTLRNYARALAAFSLLLLPLLFQLEYWEAKLAGTFFFTPDLVETSERFFGHLGSNVLYTLVSHAHNIEEDHFVVSSLLDPLTAVFVPIGLALCLKHLRGSRFARLLLVGFLLEVVLVGASHDRLFPPMTRMFLLLPWWTTMAAIGMATLVGPAAQLPRRRWLLAGIASAAVCLNLYQAYGLFPLRYEGKASFEVLFLRLIQRDDIQDPLHPKAYFFLTDSSWSIAGMRTLQEVYGLPRAPELLGSLDITQTDLEGEVLAAVSHPDTAVILQPSMDAGLIEEAGNILTALGKTECPVREGSDTDVRFSMWLSPQISSLCWWANPWGNELDRFSLGRIPLSSWILVALALAVLIWRPSRRRRFEASGPSEITVRVASGARLRVTIERLADTSADSMPEGAPEQEWVTVITNPQDDAQMDIPAQRHSSEGDQGQT